MTKRAWTGSRDSEKHSFSSSPSDPTNVFLNSEEVQPKSVLTTTNEEEQKEDSAVEVSISFIHNFPIPEKNTLLFHTHKAHILCLWATFLYKLDIKPATSGYLLTSKVIEGHTYHNGGLHPALEMPV